MSNGPLRVGIGGPVGVGKTTLTEHLCRALAGRCSMAVVTNDIYTREDAEALMRAQVLPAERIRGGRNRWLPAYRDPRGCVDQPVGHCRSDSAVSRSGSGLDRIWRRQSGGDL